MASTRLISVIAAAGVIAAGISAAAAWADGPGGVVEPDTDIYAAVGTGVYQDAIAGFVGTGATSDEASAAVLSACQAAGAQDCTVDEYTNDNLCIVSVADDLTDVVSGGAGPTIEAARADALARAAANGTPESPGAVTVVSNCP